MLSKNKDSLEKPLSEIKTKVKDTIIPLPVTETPMIMRNREMRKSTSNRRRSSLGLRGKRTSTLYNGLCRNGLNQPHECSPPPSIH
jgi:hypothetical protein